MATGGASADGGTKDPVLCPICLDPFNDPRFLPCHHTYCAQCIQDVADIANRNSQRAFPCPSCRVPTTLPTGGVQALQVNYYVNARPISSARTSATGGPMCETHVDEKLRFYCVPCRKAICRDCKLTKHERHETDDLSVAEKNLKKKMTMAKEFFRDQVQQLNRHLDSLEHAKGYAMAEKALLVRSIQDRHATLVAAADTARDEALQSLDKAMKEVEDEYDTETEKLVTNPMFQNAQGNHTKLEYASHTSIMGVLELASSMGIDVELDDSQFKRELQRRFPTSTAENRPVVRRFSKNKGCSTQSIFKKARTFMGNVVKTGLTASSSNEESQVKVMEKFTCGHEPNTRVFSLCHCDEERPSLLVSYDHCGMDTNAPVEKFSERGELIHHDEQTGKVSFKRYSQGQYAFPIPFEGWLYTYTKSLTTGHYRLDNDGTGVARIYSVTITQNPFKYEFNFEFEIQVGPHRAVDVDDTEELFVVLEEPRPPHQYRQVHLYRGGKKTPVSTYTSPIQPCHPSDVCFYTLGGQRVLLIADEVNDAIHVVGVLPRGDFQFLRYLAPDSPCLVQPTAMNVDVKGRLWVACEGGKIITIEPKSNNSAGDNKPIRYCQSTRKLALPK